MKTILTRYRCLTLILLLLVAFLWVQVASAAPAAEMKITGWYQTGSIGFKTGAHYAFVTVEGFYPNACAGHMQVTQTVRNGRLVVRLTHVVTSVANGCRSKAGAAYMEQIALYKGMSGGQLQVEINGVQGVVCVGTTCPMPPASVYERE